MNQNEVIKEDQETNEPIKHNNKGSVGLSTIPKNRVKRLRGKFSAMSKKDIRSVEEKQEVMEDSHNGGDQDFDDIPIRSSLFGGLEMEDLGSEHLSVASAGTPGSMGKKKKKNRFVGGEIVRIHNLQNSAQFNGLVAEVLGNFDREADSDPTKRWPIEIIQNGVQLAIKAENLEPIVVSV